MKLVKSSPASLLANCAKCTRNWKK